MKPLWKVIVTGLVVLLGAELVHDGVRRRARHRLPPQPPAPPLEAGRTLWIGDRRDAGEAPDGDDLDLRTDGWSSAEWVERLPEWLAFHVPERVRVSFGMEDLRRRDDRVAEPRSPRLEPHRFESLWLGLFGAGDAARSAAPQDGFVGVWHLGQVLVEFRGDGSCRLGEVEGAWSRTAPERLQMEMLGGEPFEVRWEVSGDELVLRGAGVGGIFPLRRGAPSEGVGPAVRETIGRGRLAEAMHLLGPARRGALRAPDAEVLWVELQVRSGDLEAARAGLGSVRRAAADSVDGRRRLARALLAVGDFEAAFEVCGPDLSLFVTAPAFRDAVHRAAVESSPARDRVLAALEVLPAPGAAAQWLLAALRSEPTGRLDAALRWAAVTLDGVAVVDVREVPRALCAASEVAVQDAAARLGLQGRPVWSRIEEQREAWLRADLDTARCYARNVALLRRLVELAGAELVLEPPPDPALARVGGD